MLSFKQKVAKNYINARGWNTNQKYLIIESDDWGAIRMPSREVYEELKNKNIKVDESKFDSNDSIESREDLISVFQTLKKFKDNKGNHPIVTAYYVMGNPNFEKIQADGRKNYHFETFLDTYERFTHTSGSFELVKQGMRENIFIPQFHGREHIHVKRWLEAINSNSNKEQIAFEKKAIISSPGKDDKEPYLKDYLKGFDFHNTDEHKTIESIHREGLHLFKEIFGFSSISFVAQGSVFGDHLLKMLNEEGVRLIGGQQLMPDLKGGYKSINKHWGTKNKFKQIHWRRNCMFEPGRNQNYDWVRNCLEEIEIAFRWGKPAVVSSHRENFTGSIFEENRIDSLKKLEHLLSEILIRWPDVQFISTAQLAEIMQAKK